MGIESDAEFVDYFFSGSQTLALKSSLKSHQMTTFLIQNEYWENVDFILVNTSSFWIKKFSFDDFLITTWEREGKSQKKKNHKFCS